MSIDHIYKALYHRKKISLFKYMLISLENTSILKSIERDCTY